MKPRSGCLREGRFGESATAFDELAKAVPDQAPQLWQRGIALYYARALRRLPRQFESHRTVNRTTWGKRLWHSSCVARGESPAKARAALLTVGPDAAVRCARCIRCSAERDAGAGLSAAGSQPAALF